MPRATPGCAPTSTRRCPHRAASPIRPSGSAREARAQAARAVGLRRGSAAALHPGLAGHARRLDGLRSRARPAPRSAARAASRGGRGRPGARAAAQPHHGRAAGHEARLQPVARRRRAVGDELPGALIWFVGIVGRIAWERRRDPGDTAVSDEEPPPGLTYELIVDAAAELLDGLERDSGRPPSLWAVNRNRAARPAIWRSRVTVKADAATRLFSLSCRTLCWAVLDSGVDATHPAFARRTGDEPLAATPDGLHSAADSRVRATYDFTRLRALLAAEPSDKTATESVNEINARLLSGRAVDWSLLLPHLAVTEDAYVAPSHEHGTHVAGVLAGDWRTEDPQGPADHSVQGVSPDIYLYDLQIFDETGAGDEFAILAA